VSVPDQADRKVKEQQSKMLMYNIVKLGFRADDQMCLEDLCVRRVMRFMMSISHSLMSVIPEGKNAHFSVYFNTSDLFNL